MATDALRLKGNHFAAPDFFRTDVTKGVTRTPAGTRVVTLPSDFLLGFRDALIYECGSGYRPVMTAAGKRWGKQFIKRLDRDLTAAYQTPLRDLPAGVIRTCLADAFAAHGYGTLALEVVPGDPELTVADLWHSVLPALVPDSDRPVDLLMAGFLAAIVGHLTGRPLDAVQTECPSTGGERCRFVLGPTDRMAEVLEWADEATPAPTHDDVLNRLLRATVPPARQESAITPAPVSA